MAEVELNGYRAHVEESGSGSPIVLVHGLGGTGNDIWKHQIPDLASEFRVIAYDLRGSGQSEATPGPYTIDLLTEDLHALVGTLGLGRVALMGHSMGGSIVLAYAARYPGDVLAVVGIGAPAGLPDQARSGMAARAETVEADGMAAVAETVATNGVSPTFREQRPEEFQGLIAMLAGNDPRGYAAQCRALVGLDLVARLGEIAAPVLLVSGDRDGVSPPAATEASASAVQDGRFTIVEDCGHILTWERPEALAASAWPFLREHRERGCDNARARLPQQGSEEARTMQVTDVVDLSHELYDGMPNIGRNPVSFGAIYTFAGVREMSGGRFAMQGNLIVMPEHCGTHLDAPAHFVEGGLTTAQYPLEKLVLPGHLLDLTHKLRGEAITVEDLEVAEQRSGRQIGPGMATIVWTGADAYWGEPGYDTDRPYLPVPVAQWLVDRGITLFCTDLIGMDDPGEWWWPTHELWLRAGVPMVQQLCNLDRLAGKEFTFVALPLPVRYGTGSPVRAVALVH